jgi:hypothetical protein
MKGDILPPDNHVARYCSRKFISERNSVAPGAFMLKKNERYLSVQWLEYLKQPNRGEAINKVREMLSRHLKIKRQDRIALLNVERTCKQVVEESGQRIVMLHEPSLNNEAHSGIFGVDQDQELIAEIIAETILENHPAV